MEKYIKDALSNITRYGDTDVFAFPIENIVFYDCAAETVNALNDIHKEFKQSLVVNPPFNESLLTAVGYTGFRWVTQIDPLWNAYFLSLVMSIGDDIEAARIPTTKNNVFSYRYKWDKSDKTLFDRNFGWQEFQKQSAKMARVSKNVLICDISDFYPRIYHHRLENALNKATTNTEAVGRIMSLLKSFSKGVSYGIPVGGPAARLLSELLLNRTDKLLVANKIPFCRFADDYHIFAQSTEEAYASLLFISEKLLDNEGLLLQKAKTRVMSNDEFLSMIDYSDSSETNTSKEQSARKLLSLRIHFDPYSMTAADDYEKLRDLVSQFDIINLLSQEMQKTRVHQALTKKLLATVKFMESSVIDGVIISIMENLSVLYPVYPSVILLIKNVMDKLSTQTLDYVYSVLRSQLRVKSYIVSVPTHLSYTVRLLSYDRSDEADELLSDLYKSSNSTLIRRDIILAMANRGSDYWVSDKKQAYATLQPWERTAAIIASYILNDEGQYWRSGISNRLSPTEKLALIWAGKKKNDRGKIELPL